jgi:signal peptidase I
MNALPKLLRTTLDLALVALFGLSALLLVGGFALPALGREMVIIDGGSMAPAIENGSAVIVDRTPTTVAVGDVVTIRVPSSGAVFTHRIIEIVADGSTSAVRTQGDANQDSDATASPESWIVGRVSYAIPGLGYAAAALQSGTGRAGLICLVLIVLALRWFGEDASSPKPARDPKPATERGRAA